MQIQDTPWLTLTRKPGFAKQILKARHRKDNFRLKVYSVRQCCRITVSLPPSRLSPTHLPHQMEARFVQSFGVMFKYSFICHGKDKPFPYNVSFKTHSSYIPMAIFVNSSNYCKCFSYSSLDDNPSESASPTHLPLHKGGESYCDRPPIESF